MKLAFTPTVPQDAGRMIERFPERISPHRIDEDRISPPIGKHLTRESRAVPCTERAAGAACGKVVSPADLDLPSCPAAGAAPLLAP